MTCLIPISVSGEAFRTKSFVPALRAIQKQYSRAIFLVADTLQIYNKASMAEDGSSLRDVLEHFGERNQYLQERGVWISRIRGEVGNCALADVPWDVVGIEEFSSRELTIVFRAMTILLSVDEAFGSAVRRDADEHLVATGTKGTRDRRHRLSMLYLLEEIALNVFLHVVRGFGDEYYVDGVLESVASLYSGKFGLRASEIVGSLGLPDNGLSFAFHQYRASAEEWNVVFEAEHRCV